MIFKDTLRPLYRFFTQLRWRGYYALSLQLQVRRWFGARMEVRLFGKRFRHLHDASTLYQYREIFVDRVYDFKTENSRPVIFDCGSNVGMSLIAFKRNHPGARIRAFEPDPDVYQVLKHNIESFGLEGVEATRCAVWTEPGEIRFEADGLDGGRVKNDDSFGVTVPAVRLKDHLMEFETIDFLKIDIEGAELEVLKDVETELWRVRNLFVEYHSVKSEPQGLSELLAILSRAGLRYSLTSIGECSSPFLKPPGLYGDRFDLQANIFARRPAPGQAIACFY